MSKVKSFVKAIKLIISVLVWGIKIAVATVLWLYKNLFKGIGKRLRFSITFKAASIYTFTFSVILLTLSVVMVASFGSYLLKEFSDSLEKNATVTISILKEDNVTAKKKLKDYAVTEGIVITLLDRQGEVTYVTSQIPNIKAAIKETSKPSGIFFTADEYMHFHVDTRSGDKIFQVIVSKSLTREKEYLVVMLVTLTVTFLLAITITVIIGSRTLRKMLQPIENMINTARTVSATDLKTRLNVVDSHDELKDLAETFNEMLDRIQVSYELQNRFVSDASHELRTPISVIQGYAGLLQRWGKEDKEVLAEAVVAIRNEAENMKDLVEKLLFLARADRDNQKLNIAPFSVGELVDEVIKETRLIDSQHIIMGEADQAEGKNVTCKTVTIEADRRLIKQALRILVDNSIKHTPAGGTIKINSDLQGRKVKLIVEDNGSGIPPEDVPYIFDRFYKCDISRTREAGGTGLGLSIAKWIVEKHNGSIDVESRLNQGTKMTIALQERYNRNI